MTDKKNYTMDDDGMLHSENTSNSSHTSYAQSMEQAVKAERKKVDDTYAYVAENLNKGIKHEKHLAIFKKVQFFVVLFLVVFAFVGAVKYDNRDKGKAAEQPSADEVAASASASAEAADPTQQYFVTADEFNAKVSESNKEKLYNNAVTKIKEKVESDSYLWQQANLEPSEIKTMADLDYVVTAYTPVEVVVRGSEGVLTQNAAYVVVKVDSELNGKKYTAYPYAAYHNVNILGTGDNAFVSLNDSHPYSTLDYVNSSIASNGSAVTIYKITDNKSSETEESTSSVPAASEKAAQSNDSEFQASAELSEKEIGTVIVNVENLNSRKGPGTSYDTNGKVEEHAMYPVYEKTTADGYTWYRIGEKSWVADNGDWLTYTEY